MTAPENKDLIDRKQGKNNRASSVARTLTRLWRTLQNNNVWVGIICVS